MIQTEKFEQFTVYKSDISSSFIYADFDDPDLFMKGLANYILHEDNLLNYANASHKLEFTPTAKNYKKLYTTLGTFLNSQTELLSFDKVSDEVRDVLGNEYRFVDKNGQVFIQNDKIGKIGEYIFHLLLTKYYKIECIIPKFRCITDRNMSVFGIDALFFDPIKRMILFGESKVCKDLESAITLVNRSFEDYEQQISEEYKLVLSSDDTFKLSPEFSRIFEEYTQICISFEDFIKSASIQKIGVPAFLAHGNSNSNNVPEAYLNKMNSKISRNKFFGIDTEYIFISLPIIDKSQMVDVVMKRVVEKSNEYRNAVARF